MTIALNLWDVEINILKKQKELEALHEMKESLLEDKDLVEDGQITCE